MKLAEWQTHPNRERALREALDLWLRLSDAAGEVHGDRGCCTLGGGIYAWLTPPRCRSPQKILILPPPGGYQGEVPMYAGMREAIEILKRFFPKVEFYGDHGRMD